MNIHSLIRKIIQIVLCTFFLILFLYYLNSLQSTYSTSHSSSPKSVQVHLGLQDKVHYSGAAFQYDTGFQLDDYLPITRPKPIHVDESKSLDHLDVVKRTSAAFFDILESTNVAEDRAKRFKAFWTGNYQEISEEWHSSPMNISATQDGNTSPLGFHFVFMSLGQRPSSSPRGRAPRRVNILVYRAYCDQRPVVLSLQKTQIIFFGFLKGLSASDLMPSFEKSTKIAQRVTCQFSWQQSPDVPLGLRWDYETTAYFSNMQVMKDYSVDGESYALFYALCEIPSSFSLDCPSHMALELQRKNTATDPDGSSMEKSITEPWAVLNPQRRASGLSDDIIFCGANWYNLWPKDSKLETWQEEEEVLHYANWLESMQLFGLKEFHIKLTHLFGLTLSPRTLELLEFYVRQGVVKIEIGPYLLGKALPGWTEVQAAQIFIITDCIYENMYSYKYIAIFDKDELLIPHSPTLPTLLAVVQDLLAKSQRRSTNDGLECFFTSPPNRTICPLCADSKACPAASFSFNEILFYQECNSLRSDILMEQLNNNNNYATYNNTSFVQGLLKNSERVQRKLRDWSRNFPGSHLTIMDQYLWGYRMSSLDAQSQKSIVSTQRCQVVNPHFCRQWAGSGSERWPQIVDIVTKYFSNAHPALESRALSPAPQEGLNLLVPSKLGASHHYRTANIQRDAQHTKTRTFNTNRRPGGVQEDALRSFCWDVARQSHSFLRLAERYRQAITHKVGRTLNETKILLKT